MLHGLTDRLDLQSLSWWPGRLPSHKTSLPVAQASCSRKKGLSQISSFPLCPAVNQLQKRPKGGMMPMPIYHARFQVAETCIPDPGLDPFVYSPTDDVPTQKNGWRVEMGFWGWIQHFQQCGGKCYRTLIPRKVLRESCALLRRFGSPASMQQTPLGCTHSADSMAGSVSQ